MSALSKFFQFYPGESKRLSLQMTIQEMGTQNKEPLGLSESDQIEVRLVAMPDNLILTRANSRVHISNAPLGRIFVDLSPEDTERIQSGSIVIKHTTEAGKVSILVADAAVIRLEITDG